MSKWTNEEFYLAKVLVESGVTFDVIGIKLGRSKSSVRNKMNKSGIKFTDFNPGREVRSCLHCGNDVETTLSENKKFCGNSCSASYNNKLNKKVKTVKSNCLNCDKPFYERKKKYCDSKCQHEYNSKKVFKKIEEGVFCIDSKETESKWFKKYLINKHGDKCMKCGWNEKNPVTGKVPIELEHKDGDSTNNNLSNLELLCPNCHSLTPTYKALNIGNGRHKRRERYRNEKSF